MRCIPTSNFQLTGFLWKMCRDVSHLLLSLLLLFVYFLALPSLLTSSNYLILVHVHFFSNIATESMWCHCGLVHSLAQGIMSRAFNSDPQPSTRPQITVINDSVDRQ